MKVVFTIGLLLFVIGTGKSLGQEEFDLKNLKSITEIQRNSISLDYKFTNLTLLYERTVPILNNVALLFGAGISQEVMPLTNNNFPVYKAAFMYGRLIHFAEAGVAIVPMQSKPELFNPFIGYRFQSYGGLFLRMDVLFAIDNELDFVTDESVMKIHPVPGITAGYSF